MALKQFNEDEIKQIIELFFKKIEYNNYNKTFVYSDNNPINYTINIINKDEFSSQLFNTLKENINYKEKLIYYYENKINLLFWIKDDELKTPIKEYSNILNTINKNITVSKDVAIKRPIYDQLIKKHITQCFIECSYIVHLISELCTTNNICNERKNIQNKIFDLIIKNNAILKYYEFGIELDSIYDIVRKKILNVITDYNYNLNNQLTLVKIKENLLGKLYYHYKQQYSTDFNDETILLLNDRIDEFINKYKDVLSSKTNLNILNNILNNYTLKKNNNNILYSNTNLSQYKNDLELILNDLKDTFKQSMQNQQNEIKKFCKSTDNNNNLESISQNTEEFSIQSTQNIEKEINKFCKNTKHNNKLYYIGISLYVLVIIMSLCYLFFKNKK